MTDDSQPEAMDLADWLEAVGGGPSAKRCAALLREQHTRIAELEAQIEALSGAQALSAAPRTPTVEQVEDEVSMGHGAWDMVDPQELIGAVLRLSVAASPTHPEEQAAPKAAPGEPSDADIDAFLDSPGGIEWVIADKRERYRLLVRAVLAKWAAPQQEAKEPTEIPEEIERMAADRYKVVPSHESMFHRWAVVAGTGTQQLYLGREVECQNMARKFAGAFLDGAFVAMQRTAPQPAPAPLSDDTKRLDWLDRNIFSREMSEWDAKYGHGPDYNMWVVFSPKGVQGSARNIIDAALAAQGGKDAE